MDRRTESLEYPRLVYHPVEPPRVVHSAQEQKALGHDWSETPFEPVAEPATAAPDGSEVEALRARVEELTTQLTTLQEKLAAKAAAKAVPKEKAK